MARTFAFGQQIDEETTPVDATRRTGSDTHTPRHFADADGQRRRPPPPMPSAWVSPPPRSKAGVVALLVAALVRSGVPAFGFFALHWPASEMVVLGTFNFGLLVTFTVAFDCAMPRLVESDPRRARRVSFGWVLLSVLGTWLVVWATASALRVPLVVQSERGGIHGLDPAFLASAFAIAMAGVAGYWHEMREQARVLREWVPPVRLRQRSASQIALLFGAALLGEAYLLRVVLSGLGSGELGEAWSVVVATAMALLMDFARILTPEDYFARRRQH